MHIYGRLCIQVRQLHLIRILGAYAPKLGLVVVVRRQGRAALGGVGVAQAGPVAARVDAREVDALVGGVAEAHGRRRAGAGREAAEGDEGLVLGVRAAAQRRGAAVLGLAHVALELAQGRHRRRDAANGALDVGEEHDVAGPVVEVVQGRPVVLDEGRADHGRDGGAEGGWCQLTGTYW